ncbi:hypothetical protein LSCM1_02225 [Leishmania martiniquensis]|uniref:Uncharacterized protein n=1 Tax=Leishmania martiniquensis TaxID=1580590 RepID=A0A836KDB0_9TRYP|nr:hypothetical protein LSCM1_02225 [Leishmania martiniquensis]
MMTVVFDADALKSWTLRLREMAIGGELGKEQVLSSLDFLEQLGHMTEHRPPTAMQRRRHESHLTDAASSQHTRVSAGTQLWTVHPIHYTHHVLNKVRRGRQLRALSRRLGVLAADLHAVSLDLWRLLQASSSRHPRAASQRIGDRSGAETPDRAASVATAAFPARSVSTSLSPSTCQTLRSLFGKYPSFDADLLHWPSRTEPLSTRAASLHASMLLKSKLDASAQTTQKFVAEQDAVNTPRERLLFLCRRCRQDGRAGYQVAQGRVQLTQVNDIGSAKRERGRQATLPSPSMRYSVTHRGHHAVSGNGGAQRSHRRPLSDL